MGFWLFPETFPLLPLFPTVIIQAGCALVARLLATARVFEIAVKAGYVSC